MTQTHADQAGILVVNGARDDVYKPFFESFNQVIHAGAEISANKQIERLQLENTEAQNELIRQTSAGIIVTVGTAAARRIAGLGLKTPVLYTVIPESSYLSLLPERGDCAMYSAIYIDQPLERQARLAEVVFPRARKYGALLGPVSRRHLPLLEKIAADAEWELVTDEVMQDMDPGWTTRSLVEQTDLILAISDPVTLNRNNAKWLLYTAYQEQNPVIGFSSAYVRAGAAAAVYSTPAQLGRQAAEFIQRWHSKAARCLPQPEFPSYFKVATNPDIIHSLDGIKSTVEELADRLSGDAEGSR